jgi:hypothetical protein
MTFSNTGTPAETCPLARGAKAHDPLNPRTVVPAAIEDHHFARSGQMAQVALQVHLGFPIGRCGQRHHAKHPRADTLGNGLDGAALAGAIAAKNAHLQALGDHPLL